MSRQGRILLVDDEERWRRIPSNVLQSGGFQVTSVSSAAEALEHLQSTFYHLLVLDIRMEDSDSSNVEGMNILRRLEELDLIDATQIVMLSAYGTPQQMRDAFSHYGVKDFLSKAEFKGSEFLELVRQIFTDDVKTNLNLGIQWQTSGPEQVVLDIKLNGRRIKRNTPEQSNLVEEFDDLLCRLFHKADNILVKPLAKGQSGTGVLFVQPFYSDGGAQARIVKFGDFKEIFKEYRNFEEYVQDFVGGGRSTIVRALRRTPRLGGIIYSFLGAADDQMESFSDYYSHSTVSQIEKVLQRLFLTTCGSWYSNPGQLKAFDLTEHYQQRMGFTTENLERALNEKLKANLGKHQTVSFSSLGERSFTNPISLVAEQRFIRTTYECVTHGDLNASNILIDSDKHAWLIDFGSTGKGHILRDVAELDSVVRLQLLAAEEATLEERLKMEEVLLSITRFDQVEELAAKFSPTTPALAKAFSTTLILRSIAAKLIAPHRNTDISEYHIALFYYALNTTRFYALETVQRQHAFLCASLLSERLNP